MRILFKKLHPKAQKPYKKHPEDAGYDLHACEKVTIPAKGIAFVETGIAICPPKDFYAEIHSRSSLRKKGIIPPTGIIDTNYRGGLGVILYNFSSKTYNICEGDRIAQLIFKRNNFAEFTEVDNLPKSNRGSMGFGSSGR
jgi:dUTP pyrophosphatase